MLTLTSPVETPLHRWPAWLKLGLLLAATTSLFLLHSPQAIVIASAFVAAVYLAQGARFARMGLRLLWPVWPLTAL